ncbi:MAG: hypothetical protein IJB89_07370, partial [Akkermansia sp.]|nr:hypothetical protein [Akkermansia sp.]
EGLIAVLPPSPHPARAVWAPSETFLGGFWVLLLFLHFSESETLHLLNVFSLYTRGEKVYAERNALIYQFARRYDDRSADSPEFP